MLTSKRVSRIDPPMPQQTGDELVKDQNSSKIAGNCFRSLLMTLMPALLMGSGCATFNPENVAERPWNRQTKEEISQGTWFQWWRWNEQQPPRANDHYP